MGAYVPVLGPEDGIASLLLKKVVVEVVKNIGWVPLVCGVARWNCSLGSKLVEDCAQSVEEVAVRLRNWYLLSALVCVACVMEARDWNEVVCAVARLSGHGSLWDAIRGTHRVGGDDRRRLRARHRLRERTGIIADVGGWANCWAVECESVGVLNRSSTARSCRRVVPVHRRARRHGFATAGVLTREFLARKEDYFFGNVLFLQGCPSNGDAGVEVSVKSGRGVPDHVQILPVDGVAVQTLLECQAFDLWPLW